MCGNRGVLLLDMKTTWEFPLSNQASCPHFAISPHGMFVAVQAADSAVYVCSTTIGEVVGCFQLFQMNCKGLLFSRERRLHCLVAKGDRCFVISYKIQL